MSPSPSKKAESRRKIDVLAVGEVLSWTAQGKVLPFISGLRFSSFQEIESFVTGQDDPEVVLSSLTALRFDAIDVAQLLVSRQFQGVYYIVTHPLPAPDLVRREIAQVAPGLNFELVSHEELSALRQSETPQRQH